MLAVFVRTFALYSIVVITMRLMGKRQIGQLEPFELVIAIMIAELAAVPMEDRDIPLVNGIIPIVTLLFLQVLISYVSLKFLWFREAMDGTPDVIVKDGKIIQKAMYNARYNLDELLEQLRVKGYANLGDVEYAILETSGDLSVIPKSQKRPVTPEDLSIATQYEGMPTPLIMDGHVMNRNLKQLKLSSYWLNQQLANAGYAHATQVFFAIIDTQGKIYIQPREGFTPKSKGVGL